jgi:hypothetical protein
MVAYLHRKVVTRTLQNEHVHVVCSVCQDCHSFGVGWSNVASEAENVARSNLMTWECGQGPQPGGSTVFGNGASYIAGERRPAG